MSPPDLIKQVVENVVVHPQRATSPLVTRSTLENVSPLTQSGGAKSAASSGKD
jgi:hypothetical protein